MTGGYYVDTPPTISNITPASLVVQKSSTSAPVTFTVADVNTGANSVTMTASSDNTTVIANGSIVLGGSGASRTVTVTSTATTGSANITLKASDGLLSSTAVLPVRVNAIPILTTNNFLGVNQGSSGVLTMAQLQAIDPDTAIAPTFIVGGQPHDGTLFLNGVPNPASFTQTDVNNGNVSYTNDGSCNTLDNFQFTVEDVDGGFANDPSQGTGPTSYSFNFSITLAQTPPVAQSASYSLALGGTLNKTLVATSGDCSKPAITYQQASPPAHGTLSIDPASGAFTYTASAGASGADSFTYTATTYGTMVSMPATITLDIEEQAPVANSATINPNEGVAYNGTLTATDANLPPLTLTYALDALPTKGTVVLNDATTGSFTYTPTAGLIGQDSFTFNVSNGSLTSADATITINIRRGLHSGDLVISDDGDATHPSSIVLFDPLTHQQALISDDPLLSSSGSGPPSPVGVALAPDGKILVATNGMIVRVDPADGSATTFASGFGFAFGVAVEANGNVLVTDPFAGISRLDGTTGAVIGTLSVGPSTAPVGIAVASDTSLYVSDLSQQFKGAASNSVFHMNADGTGLTTLTTGNHIVAPAGLVLDGGNLYVSNATFGPGGTNDVIQVDTTTGAQTVLTHDSSISDATGIAFYAGQLYVVSQTTAAIIGVDLASGTQTPLTANGYLHVPFSIAGVPVRASVTTITAEAPDPSGPTASYNVSVSVAAVAGSDTPTGTVAVDDGAGGTCTITLAGGSGNCDLATAAPGSFTLTATYAGDDVFGTSAATASHSVGVYPTSTAITSDSPDPSGAGLGYKVGFTVTNTATAAVAPTGSVTVADGQGATCSATLASADNGAGSCTLASAAPGAYTLTATFTGDATFGNSASTGTPHNVAFPPVAVNDSYSTNANTAFTGNVLSNDTDPGGLSLVVTTAGSFTAGGIGGAVVMAANGGFTYTPPLNTTGAATFSYTVSDGLGTASATVTIAVTAAVNVGVSLSTAQSYYLKEGSLASYTLTARNQGPLTATNAGLNVVFPPQLTSAHWTCTGTGTATCPAASGSGDISVSVTIPSGSTLVFDITATAALAPQEGKFDLVANIKAPSGIPDTDASDNKTTLSQLLDVFGNSFEIAGVTGVQSLRLGADVMGIHSTLVNVAEPSSLGAESQTVATLQDTQGPHAVVLARAINGHQELRVSWRSSTGAWSSSPWQTFTLGQPVELHWVIAADKQGTATLAAVELAQGSAVLMVATQ